MSEELKKELMRPSTIFLFGMLAGVILLFVILSILQIVRI